MRFEVLNLGVPGYDIGYAAQHLKDTGLKYNPDLVIWLLNGFNFFQLKDAMQNREDQILHAMGERNINEQQTNGKFYEAANIAKDELGEDFGKEAILKQQETYLYKMNTYYHGPLVFSLFPGQDPAIVNLLTGYINHRKSTYLYQSLPPLDKLHGLLPDGHPNALGHTLISTKLFTYLMSSKILPSCGIQ